MIKGVLSYSVFADDYRKEDRYRPIFLNDGQIPGTLSVWFLTPKPATVL